MVFFLRVSWPPSAQVLYRADATGKCYKLNNLQNRRCRAGASTVDFVAVRSSKSKDQQSLTAVEVLSLNLKDFREGAG